MSKGQVIWPTNGPKELPPEGYLKNKSEYHIKIETTITHQTNQNTVDKILKWTLE